MFVTNDKILKGMEVSKQYFHSTSGPIPIDMNEEARYNFMDEYSNEIAKLREKQIIGTNKLRPM